MRHRWVYLMIVVVGAFLAIGIAGLPSTHSDPPMLPRMTTTTVEPTTSGTG